MPKAIHYSPIVKLSAGLKDLLPLLRGMIGPTAGTILSGRQLKSYYSGILNDIAETDDNREALWMLRSVASEVSGKSGSGVRPALLWAAELILAVRKLLASGIPQHEVRIMLDRMNTEFSSHVEAAAVDFMDSNLMAGGEWGVVSAAITACGDSGLGKDLGELCYAMGLGGHISLQISDVPGVRIVRGAGYPLEYKSLLARDCRIAGLGEARVILSDTTIDNLQFMVDVLVACNEQDRPLFILAPGLHKDVRQLLEHNIRSKAISLMAVIPPEFDLDRQLVLQDLASVTGAQVYGQALPFSGISGIGDAEVSVNKNTVMLQFPTQPSTATLARIESYTTNPRLEPRKALAWRKHLGGLSGKSAKVLIGDLERVSAQETYYRVETTVHTACSVLRHGCVTGGYGTVLSFTSRTHAGISSTLLKAISSAPKALHTRWLDTVSHDLLSPVAPCYFDVKYGRIMSAVDTGVVDSAFALKTAMDVAVSAVKTYALSGAIVREL